MRMREVYEKDREIEYTNKGKHTRRTPNNGLFTIQDMLCLV